MPPLKRATCFCLVEYFKWKSSWFIAAPTYQGAGPLPRSRKITPSSHFDIHRTSIFKFSLPRNWILGVPLSWLLISLVYAVQLQNVRNDRSVCSFVIRASRLWNCLRAAFFSTVLNLSNFKKRINKFYILSLQTYMLYSF